MLKILVKLLKILVFQVASPILIKTLFFEIQFEIVGRVHVNQRLALLFDNLMLVDIAETQEHLVLKVDLSLVKVRVVAEELLVKFVCYVFISFLRAHLILLFFNLKILLLTHWWLVLLHQILYGIGSNSVFVVFIVHTK